MEKIEITPGATSEPIILPRSEHTLSRRHIDPDALRIMFRLQRLGFIAYLTGGAVRDMLLGKTPKDFDIATDAHPAQVKKYFGNAFIIGRRFRLAHIHFRGGKIIEVATFRKDPGPAAAEALPSGSALPLAFGTPAEDAWRRDITINALFYDPTSATVIDYVGGVADLRQERIRVIGEAGERFREDPVRIWRVIRYAARLGFVIGADVGAEIQKCRHLLANCSEARLFEEFLKDLQGPRTRSVVDVLRKFGILRLLLGHIGEACETDPLLFARACSYLAIEDNEKSSGRDVGPAEICSLLFWPWAESQLVGSTSDPYPVLKKAFMNAGMVIALPKSLRAAIIDIMALVSRMLRALDSGNMRWSMRERPYYPVAARICFLIQRRKAPLEGESFETIYQEAFRGRPVREGRHPRHRRRKNKPTAQ
jgi:poly(A) polymerase